MTLPKKAWFFWGNDTMSFLRYMTLKSFSHHNPDWEANLIVPDNPIGQKADHRIWPEEQDYTYYNGANYTEQAHEIVNVIQLKDIAPEFMGQPPNVVGDLLKWFMLGFDGGVFSDMDILYIKPIPHEKYQFIKTGMYKYLYNAYPTGFLVGNQSSFFQLVHKQATKCLSKALLNYQAVGPLLLRAVYRSVRGKYGITFLPNATVYPFIDGRGRCEQWDEHLSIPFTQASEDIQLPDECFGIHWYGGCEAARQYNTVVDLNTYKNMKCLITREINRTLRDV